MSGLVRFFKGLLPTTPQALQVPADERRRQGEDHEDDGENTITNTNINNHDKSNSSPTNNFNFHINSQPPDNSNNDDESYHESLMGSSITTCIKSSPSTSRRQQTSPNTEDNRNRNITGNKATQKESASNFNETEDYGDEEQQHQVYEEEKIEADEEREEISFEQWRQERNDILTFYMEQRLVKQEKIQEGEEKENEKSDKNDNNAIEDKANEYESQDISFSQHAPENDEIDVPAWDTQDLVPPLDEPETQQHHHQQHIASSPEKSITGTHPHQKEEQTSTTSIITPPPYHNDRIPHIDETSNDCTAIETLDLYTRTANLNLCRIDKIWPIRKTSRPEWMNNNSTTADNKHIPEEDMLDNNNVNKLPYPYKNFEDDGPLSTLYKQVISVEISQPYKSNDTLKNAARAAFSISTTEENDDGEYRPKPCRLRVYIYGKYAHHFSQFVSKYNNGKTNNSNRDGNNTAILLSLLNVPPKCIMPFCNLHSSSSWLDREELSNYCICIGDKSSMRIENVENNDDGSKVCFHSENFQLHLARVCGSINNGQQGKGQRFEIAIKPENVRQKNIEILSWDDKTMGNSPSLLLNAYRKWENSEIKKKKNEEDERQQAAARAATELVPPNGESKKSEGPTTNYSKKLQHRTKRSPVGDSHYNPPSPAKKQKTDSYNYDNLSELDKIYESYKRRERSTDLINVYGVVLGFAPPSQTKRGDYFTTITIVDESLRLPISEDAITETRTTDNDDNVVCTTVNVFRKDRNTLPLPLMCGDIIRCHRVAVQKWQDDIQLLGRYKSSFVILRPKEIGENGTVLNADRQENWDINPTGTNEFTYTQDQHERAVQLWQWGQQRLQSHATMRLSHRFQLCDMKRQGEGMAHEQSKEAIVHGDLTVMVAAIIPEEQQNGILPKGYLRVWDGTGAPSCDPLPTTTLLANNSIRNGDPPHIALESIASIVHDMNKSSDTATDDSGILNQSSSDLRKILEPPKCVCGRVVNCAIWEDEHWNLVTAVVRIGTFIRLRNVEDNCLQKNGLRCLMVYTKSCLTPLPDNTFEIRTLLQEHQERIARKEPFNPKSGLLPLSNDDVLCTTNSNMSEIVQRLDATATSVSAVSNFSSDQHSKTNAVRALTLAEFIASPPNKPYPIAFRIDRVFPSVGENEIGLRSLCEHTTANTSSLLPDNINKNMIYRFSVHIYDSTASIDVVFENDIGESFLGCTADEACRSTKRGADMLDVITRKERQWTGTVRRIGIQGKQFFVLETLAYE